MHVALSLRDAHTVIEAGWAEPHLLAGKSFVPLGLVMVYAPRNHNEIDVVLKILLASFEFAKSGPDSV